MSMILSDDAWVHIGLHLKPRHLSKLMRTCKRINRLVDNETYWTRVAAHLVWREQWSMEIEQPYDGYIPSEPLLPVVDSGWYNMVGLDRGYYWSMESFIQRIQDSLDAYSCNGDDDDWVFTNQYQALNLKERTVKLYRRGWNHEGATMKGLAKQQTILHWVTYPSRDFKGEWPKLQKFVCDLEDDPIPAVYKRQMLRKMRDSIGSELSMSNGTGSDHPIGWFLFIF